MADLVARGERVEIADHLVRRAHIGGDYRDEVTVDLAALVQNVAETLKPLMDVKELRLEISGRIPQPIEGDATRLRQVFINLLDNAIKYTPEAGSVSVSCFVDHNEVSVEVADTGIGIPRDDLPRIFERFYRVDKARSRELGGTGLGLSIVKHLVQSVGGQIDVASRVGSVSRFTVHLPRATMPGARSSATGRSVAAN